MNIAYQTQQIRQSIEEVCRASGRKAATITLLAAAKAQNNEKIEEAIAAGIVDFGENKVQEAKAKWPELKKKYPKLRLHLIGSLQTNKVKEALGLFDVIQTLDRKKLADAFVKAGGYEGKRFFIQVNTGRERQKSGVTPEEADDFITYCQSLGLKVVGLMCVPPADEEPAPHFTALRALARKHDLAELSMGMSDDYEIAVREDSTCVRLGRILFGERH